MYNIQQKLVKVNKYSRPGMKQLAIRAIVIHWTANPGATALNHYNYFNNGGGGRYAGAHYFVDKTSILQLVPDNEVAYHANEKGTSKVSYLNNLKVGTYKGNANVASIGIEMCVEKDGSYHPETLKRTYWLANHLLKKHGLSNDRIVRHYDITGKSCPANFLTDAKWKAFKAEVAKVGAPVATPAPSKPATTTSYRVRIIVDSLNVRSGAGVSNPITTVVKKGEVYTIVETKNGWGKLKSGAGWINVGTAYVQKV